MMGIGTYYKSSKTGISNSNFGAKIHLDMALLNNLITYMCRRVTAYSVPQADLDRYGV